MAIYESSFLSSIKGSVGGITFYTGQNGHIMRTRNINRNVNTLSQIDARILLKQSISGYQNLSVSDKSSWNSWALTNWYSIRNPESVNRSGYVAYRSVKNVINTINSHFLTPTCKFLPSALNAPFTEAPLSFVNPPVNPHILADIIDAPGSSYPLQFINCTLTSAGLLQFDVQFGLIPHVLTTNGQLQDSNSQRYVVEIFLSNPGSSINFKPKNFLTKLIACTKNLTFTIPGLTGASGLRMNFDCSSLLANSKYSIMPTKYYYVSFVLVAVNGTQIVASRKCILTT